MTIMEIPTNDYSTTNVVNEVAAKVLNGLKENWSVALYKSDCPNATIAREVGKMFIKKGYYAKINWFVESWKGMQCLVVSKRPLGESTGRLIYSEFIH